jgi:hypothetical protein
MRPVIEELRNKRCPYIGGTPINFALYCLEEESLRFHDPNRFSKRKHLIGDKYIIANTF